jgi:hypothetical protein
MSLYLGSAAVGLQALPDPEQALEVPRNSQVAVHELLNGHRAFDRTPYRVRDWNIAWDVMTEDEFGLLAGIADGSFGPPLFLFIDPNQRNYLEPNQSSAGSSLGTIEGFFSPQALSVVTTQLLGTSKSLQWPVTTSAQQMAAAFTAVNAADPNQDSPVVVGLSYTGSVSARASVAVTVRLDIVWCDKTGAVLSTTAGTATALTTTGWQRLVTSGAAPANALFGFLRLQTTTIAASNVFTSQWQFEPGNAVSNWVTGQGSARVGPFDIQDTYPWLPYHAVSIALQEA